MGRPQSAITRREVLKRGAIVGGGILWVTPIVQTIGMGPAYAAPVSGAGTGDRCQMTIQLKSCTSATTAQKRTFTFETCILAGCPCRQGDISEVVVFESSANPGLLYSTGAVDGAPGCHERTLEETLDITLPTKITALCMLAQPTDGGIINYSPQAWSDPFELNEAAISACFEGTG